MKGTRWGWRWRENPLRRRSDVVEGWTVLVLGAAVIVGAPAAGLAAGWSAHTDARALASAQRQERHRVDAEVVGAVPSNVVAGEPGTQTSFRVPVRWRTAEGDTRTGTARVRAGVRQGERTDVWLDRRGRQADEPLPEAEVWTRTLTTGVGSGIAVVGVAGLVGWGLVCRLDRGRLAEWEREWAVWDGPERGRRTA
ncbi:Rv1733c family protein [Streptomyces sp. SDT5-1]|uniref:Rv1733c family protein n=1 Tax=Streptomyces sp. SDT5-1 TaxID=3406418 RepID=UPI003FCFD11F